MILLAELGKSMLHQPHHCINLSYFSLLNVNDAKGLDAMQTIT